MEVLKPIFCTTSLIGIHFTTPYLSLLIDKETTYSKLIESFPVYKDLAEMKPEKMLQTEAKVITFVSEKMVINKSMDLLEKSCANEIFQYRKPAKDIKEIKTQWKSLVESQKAENYNEKEKVTLREESIKYELLEKLKAEEVPGPFTNSSEVQKYGLSIKYSDTEKNKRMYCEVS